MRLNRAYLSYTKEFSKLLFLDWEYPVTGIPDFLIKDGNSYKIRDCKLARHADQERHEEIPLQLQLYGWLFEMTFRRPPALLEAYLGDGSIVPISYNGGAAALKVLKDISELARHSVEPFSPVGWSKCGACGFQPRCWKLAEESNDVALVFGVDQATAIALKEKGIRSIEELIGRFDENTLSDLKKARGSQMVRVGKAATRILQQAEALRS